MIFIVSPEQSLEYLKTKMGTRRPQEEGMAFKKYINEIKSVRDESNILES